MRMTAFQSTGHREVKNTHTFYSLPLYPIVLSICVCALLGLSQIFAKIRNICEKNLSVASANVQCLFLF